MSAPGPISAESECQHDWEFSKENAAPLECGRSTKHLSKRAFGTSSEEQAKIDEKTKKFERIIRRSERAVEWLGKQSKKLLDNDESRDLTEDEAQSLRDRLASELDFNPSTSSRDHIDHDPLKYWVLYIKHIREAYPSDSQKQFLLMERCARTFMSRPFLVPTYRNDVRFIRTCILYADKTSSPSAVFKLMSKLKVGTKVSLFWVAWAWVAEKASDFQFTEKIFMKGLSVGAEPKRFLEERQRQFHRRMSRLWLNANKQEENSDELDIHEEHAGRAALNSLTSSEPDRSRGFRANNIRQNSDISQSNGRQSHLARNSSRSRPINASGTAGGAFNIFQDRGGISDDRLNDEEGARGLHLTKESDRTKENTMRPERWNERGYGLVNRATASDAGADSIVGTVRPPSPERRVATAHHSRAFSSSAAFEVFVDEEFGPDEGGSNEHGKGKSEKVVDSRSLRQRLDGGAADRLTRDPLRYMKNPSKIISDQIKYDGAPVGHRRAESKTAEESNCHPGKSTLRNDGNERLNDAKGNNNINKQDALTDIKDQFRSSHVRQHGEKMMPEHEISFEERRAIARFYKCLTSTRNFNLLKREENSTCHSKNDSSQMDCEDSEDEVEMEDDTIPICEKGTNTPNAPSCFQRKSLDHTRLENNEAHAENPRRVLFAADTNVEHGSNACPNTSTISSQLDDNFVQAEETINTKIAHAEISMMFSSPGNNVSVAQTPGRPLMEPERMQPLFSAHRKEQPSTTKKVMVEIDHSRWSENCAISCQRKSGNCAQDDNVEANTAELSSKANDENCHPQQHEINASQKENHNPQFIRPNDRLSKPPSGGLSFTIFQDDDMANTTKPSFKGCQSKAGKSARYSGDDTATLSVIGDVMSGLQNCSVREDGTISRGGLDFGIFEDPIESQAQCDDQSKQNSRESSCGEGLATSSEDQSIVSSSKRSGAGFGIYQDRNEINETMMTLKSGNTKSSRSGLATHTSEKSVGHCFDIYEDEEAAAEHINRCSPIISPRKNASTHTIEGNAFEEEHNPTSKGNISAVDRNLETDDGHDRNSVVEPGFSIFTDCKDSSEKTPNLGFKIFSDEENNIPEPENSWRQSKTSSTLGFEIFSDSSNSPNLNSVHKKRKVIGRVPSNVDKENQRNSCVESEPNFGDISRIDSIGGEKTISNVQVTDDNSLPPLQESNSKPEPSGCSKIIDYISSHNECMELAMSDCMTAGAKSTMKKTIFDNREEKIPRALLRKSFSSGTSIDLLSGETATILNELGRGVYGVVLLCIVSQSGCSTEGESSALKVQAPIGCLAHEYSTLIKIQQRVRVDTEVLYPFPQPRALYAFSEGGLLLMTAASDSGMNLIDVVNAYRMNRGNVPELVAMYYTSRMLKHLETLHRDGKILHCDVKPDNWVLTLSSKVKSNADNDIVGGADLMLVDFGRAVDLHELAGKGSNPLKTLFRGSVAAEDMECGTMRQGLPWGLDLDTFGLCASSFTLLFGSHMDIIQDKNSGRWRPQKPFRRYWQKDLWHCLFDSLLNFDSKSDVDILRDVRHSFDEYIGRKADRRREIESHLKQMFSYLPKKR